MVLMNCSWVSSPGISVQVECSGAALWFVNSDRTSALRQESCA